MRSRQVWGAEQPHYPCTVLPDNLPQEGQAACSLLSQTLREFPAKGHCPGKVPTGWPSSGTTIQLAISSSPNAGSLSASTPASPSWKHLLRILPNLHMPRPGLAPLHPTAGCDVCVYCLSLSLASEKLSPAQAAVLTLFPTPSERF